MYECESQRVICAAACADHDGVLPIRRELESIKAASGEGQARNRRTIRIEQPDESGRACAGKEDRQCIALFAAEQPVAFTAGQLAVDGFPILYHPFGTRPSP